MVDIDQNELQPAADEPTNLEPKKASYSETKQVNKAVQTSDEKTTDALPKNYSEKSFEELILLFEKLLKADKISSVKEDAELIRSTFNQKYSDIFEEKKAAFLKEGGNEIDFEYQIREKRTFDKLFQEYKRKRTDHYKSVEQNLKENLEKRKALIEELKSLIGIDQSINTTYQQFKKLQESWRNVGAIPRTEANNIWKTYHHHVERFYDFLHLNRELRELDFKFNFEQKTMLIEQAEKLIEHPDPSRSFRDLQRLHRRWKDELGPVAKEHKDALWERFSAATKKVHANRQFYLENQEIIFKENLAKKNALIGEMEQMLSQNPTSHREWSQLSKSFEELRETFFTTGKVPKSENSNIWGKFKELLRAFNKKRNVFYKYIKKESAKNLELKRALIAKVDELKDSKDFKTTTPLIIQLQKDWKEIGAVDRKHREKVWKQFKAACNHYFNQMDASRNQESQEHLDNLEKKQAILDALTKLTENEEDSKKMKVAIEEYINDWKQIGDVPRKNNNIQNHFNTLLKKCYEKSGVKKSEVAKIMYDNKLQLIEGNQNAINKELISIQKKIDDTKNELNQLENNLQFFADGSEDSPLVKKVHADIKKHQKNLEILSRKKSQLKGI
ncbi:MAG: DUF349 domain-containing protein [Flavobacteriaceae bacterium]|nr:DUF349 domain-containing protein [Flavobacteriaceae bacterium]